MFWTWKEWPIEYSFVLFATIQALWRVLGARTRLHWVAMWNGMLIIREAQAMRIYVMGEMRSAVPLICTTEFNRLDEYLVNTNTITVQIALYTQANLI